MNNKNIEKDHSTSYVDAESGILDWVENQEVEKDF